MIFDGHGDVWTDVTCRAVDHGERDIFRKHHLHKFQEGGGYRRNFESGSIHHMIVIQ